jgi:hypothetical protein
MEPLYERLLKKPFPDSVSAIEYCRSVCAEFGFTVKQEASANRVKYTHMLFILFLLFLTRALHRIFMYIVPEKDCLIPSAIPSHHPSANVLPSDAIVAGALYYQKMNMRNGNFVNL